MYVLHTITRRMQNNLWGKRNEQKRQGQLRLRVSWGCMRTGTVGSKHINQVGIDLANKQE